MQAHIYQQDTMKYPILIDLERDALFDEVAMTRFKKDYILYEYGETSPQHRYAYISSRFGSNQEHAQRIYEYLSKHWLSAATPVLQSHVLNKKALPASCFLSMTADKRDALVHSLVEAAWLSMSGGGIGHYFDTRAADKKSAGKMPHINILNKIPDGYKQNSRRGAIAIYADIDDLEIEQFIDLRNPRQHQGGEAALNLHHAVNITDEFMHAVLDNKDVTLRCKKTGRTGQSINARSLLMRVIEARCKFGEPYIHFIDTSNKKMPEFQKKLGLKIHQSNLCCVSGDAKVWVQCKYTGAIRLLPAQFLAGSKQYLYLNRTGFIQPKVPMKLIRKNAPLLKIRTQNGWSTKVTPEHKCYVQGKGLVEARYVKVGDVFESPKTDNVYELTVVEIKRTENQDVYCLNMGTEDTLWVCDSFYTGNSEIILPTSHDRTAVCFLSSLNLTHYDAWKQDELFLRDVTEYMDNVVQVFIDTIETELEEAKDKQFLEDNRATSLVKAYNAAKNERSIGIGILGYHDYLQQHMVSFESPLAVGLTRSIFSHIQQGCEKATEELGVERGSCPDAINGGYDKPRRNAHIFGIAPNASTSLLCGNTSPSIEPWNSNVFTQSTQAGAFMIVNKRLTALLQKKYEQGVSGKFSKYKTWDKFYEKAVTIILSDRGSVKSLDFLSDEEKAVFKTAFEIDQAKLIELAAHRQEFIDQSQSLNLFYDTTTVPSDKMFSDILYAWVRGVKTLYYQRGLAIEKADKVGTKKKLLTLEDRLKGKVEATSKQKSEPTFIPITESTCLSCEG